MFIPLLQVNSCFILVKNCLGCTSPSVWSLAILQLGGRESGILLVSLEVVKLGLARSLVFCQLESQSKNGFLLNHSSLFTV